MKQTILELIEQNRMEMESLGAWHEVIIAQFAEQAIKSGADPLAIFWGMKQRFGMGY
jgi:hypothetical protein